MTRFLLAVHENPGGTVVAACDSDVVGDTFTEGDTRLHVEEGFYGDTEATLDEIITAIQNAATANIVGTALVEALVEEGAVNEEEVHTVEKIKHVQLFFL